MTDQLDGLKQRLVGAVVILSLAIIFIPMVFDKPHVESASPIQQVPPAPEMKKITIAEPKKPTYELVELDPSDNKVKPASKVAKPVPATVAKTEEKAETAPTKVAAPSKPVAESSKPRIELAKGAEKSTPRVSQLPAFKNIWLVQLGTFSQTKNAYALRDKLRKDGFDGHLKEVTRNGKKSLQVFTGPFVNKKEANRVKLKVDAKYKLKSIVVYIDK